MAEHSAVNRRVVGSSPTWGAIQHHDNNVMVLFRMVQKDNVSLLTPGHHSVILK